MTTVRLIAAAFGLLPAIPAAPPRPAACLAVHGESILAGDLAVANPVFAALDPQLSVGLSPMAGARRDFSIPELAAVARRHGVPAAPMHQACFEWPSQVLTPVALAAAMGRVLDCDAGAIEIVEYSRFPAPPGELVFERENLVPVTGSGGRLQLWRGFVHYGMSRRFPVWARVRIALPTVRIVALEALPPGQPIQESQVALKTMEDALVDGVFAGKVSEVAGRTPAARIEPGAAIRLSNLKAKAEIAAGDDVQVEVRNGAMRIYATARAEQSGRLGDTISLTNLQSLARFRARVEGRSKVSLTVQPRESRQ